MDTSWLDIRLGWRNLGRRPGFTAATLLLLVLGIGSNTAIFTLLEAIFVRPLPVEAPRELVALYQTKTPDPNPDPSGLLNFSYPNYRDVRDRTHAFSGLALFQWSKMSLAGGTEPERVVGTYVTGNYFEVLGVRPSLGRFFLPEEDRTPGSHPVVVLSHGCWQRLFASDPNVLNKVVTVNGRRFTVVGVGPKGFKGTEINTGTDFWIPIMMYEQLSAFPRQFQARDDYPFRVFGRLAPGKTMEQAIKEMADLAHELEREYPKENKKIGIALLPLIENAILPRERARFVGYGWTLVCAAALILLIACINVANLLLARGVERSRELAIRQAIGADRGALVRLLLFEAILLFAIGGALSLPAGRWSLDLLWSLRPPDFAQDGVDLQLNGFVLGGTLLVALLTSLLFGLLPVVRSSQPDFARYLMDSQPPDRGHTFWQPRKLLVAGQMALALFALIGAGLLLRSLGSTRQIDLGFEPDHLLAMTVAPGDQGYDKVKSRQLYNRMLERATSVSGVESAALSENRLLRGGVVRRAVYLAGQETADANGGVSHRTNVIAPGFFRTVGIPLVAGRDFGPQDCETCPRVSIVNQTMAKTLWPGQDPVGKTFQFEPGDPPIQVVGVARDARYRYVRETPQFFIYLPLEQNHVASMTLHVRTKGDPEALLQAVRRDVQAVEPAMPISEINTLPGFVREGLWMEQMSAGLLSLFGLLALALSVVGVYSVMAYSVARRQREIGIRLALGALPSQILRTVLFEAIAVIGSGMILGWVLAWFLLKPVVSTQLYGIGLRDPLTYVGQSLLLLAAALFGSYLPARRAARLSPTIPLRST